MLVYSSMLLELGYRISDIPCATPPPPTSSNKSKDYSQSLEGRNLILKCKLRLSECPSMSYDTYVTVKTCGSLIDTIRLFACTTYTLSV